MYMCVYHMFTVPLGAASGKSFVSAGHMPRFANSMAASFESSPQGLGGFGGFGGGGLPLGGLPVKHATNKG